MQIKRPISHTGMTRLSLNIEKVADLSESDKSFKFSITFVREETTLAGGFRGITRNHRFVVLPSSVKLVDGRLMVGQWSVDGWLVDGWLVDGRLVDGWLVDGRLVDGQLVDGWLVDGWSVD